MASSLFDISNHFIYSITLSSPSTYILKKKPKNYHQYLFLYNPLQNLKCDMQPGADSITGENFQD